MFESSSIRVSVSSGGAVRAGIVALVVLGAVGTAQAQTEDTLRQFFEGKRVIGIEVQFLDGVLVKYSVSSK
jgi:hypothetical protein